MGEAQGRDFGDTASGRKALLGSNAQRLGEKCGKDPPLGLPEGPSPVDPDFRPVSSGSMRERSSEVVSRLACGILFQHPEQTPAGPGALPNAGPVDPQSRKPQAQSCGERKDVCLSDG